MYACMIFVFSGSLAFVTPTCYVDEETMIEPEQIVYVDDNMQLDDDMKSVRAPQAYTDYWRLRGVPTVGSWNPDMYVKLVHPGILIVHEPWRTPAIRKSHGHYSVYYEHLKRFDRRWKRRTAREWRVMRRLAAQKKASKPQIIKRRKRGRDLKRRHKRGLR